MQSVFFDKKSTGKKEAVKTHNQYAKVSLTLFSLPHSTIPGKKAKIALYSTTPNIDPVGATVGVKGVRINAVSNELNGENIDAIEYSNEPSIFVARALAPAIVSSVKIEGDKAIVSLVPEQKSKAIGVSGINIRLASMLTKYEIELQELSTQPNQINNEEGLKNLKALFGDL